MNSPPEQWRVCPGFSDYQVSNHGKVRRAAYSSKCHKPLGEPLAAHHQANGYLAVNLYRDGQVKRRLVHRLVATAFLGTPPSILHEVRHLDGSRDNNHSDNLCWGTRSENHADKHQHNTWQGGSKNGNSVLTENQVRQIKARLPGNMSQLAREFKVSHTTISRIACGRTWKHLDEGFKRVLT